MILYYIIFEKYTILKKEQLYVTTHKKLLKKEDLFSGEEGMEEGSQDPRSFAIQCGINDFGNGYIYIYIYWNYFTKELS